MASGIMYVYDILDENGEFLNHNDITRKFDTGWHFVNMLQLRLSMPLEWRMSAQNIIASDKVTAPFAYAEGNLTCYPT